MTENFPLTHSESRGRLGLLSSDWGVSSSLFSESEVAECLLLLLLSAIFVFISLRSRTVSFSARVASFTLGGGTEKFPRKSKTTKFAMCQLSMSGILAMLV